MTDQERIDREALLKRAAAIAGAVYAAPILTSSAGAGTQGACVGKCHNHRRCQRRGGRNCFCDNGRCRPRACPCDRQNPNPCGPLEQCGGNCGCFLNAKGGTPNGVCIDLREWCTSFEFCDADNNCPPGKVCFLSCCDRPLCGECCTGAAATARAVAGAGALYT